MFQFDLEKKTENSHFSQDKKWDVLVVGGGPGGLNAALYAKRKGLDVGIITDEVGGQLHNTTEVDNYLGFSLVEGKELSDKFLTHVQNLDIPILSHVFVTNVQKVKEDFILDTTDGKTLRSKVVIIATGGAPRKLDVPGEATLSNKGVSYCTTCDAPFFKDKHIIVAGGGNSAAEAVLDLVPWAKEITVVHRSNWRADQILLDKHKHIPNLSVHLQTQILSVLGQDKMIGVEVLDKTTNQKRIIDADGLFIEIGTVPNSSFLQEIVDLNEAKEVLVDQNQQTSLKGMYAVGDVTAQPHKQIIISAAEGAKAALAATQYLNQEYKGE